MVENSEICDKKRKSDPTKYDRNIIKNARVEGKSYTSSKGKNISAKHVGSSPCRLKCYEKFSEDDKLQIFQRFYSLQTKDEQDIFLEGLIQVLNIKQRRPRQKRKYLDRDLTICTMHRLFQQKHPNIMLSFSFYRRANFNFSFGRPQVDVCSTCELLNNKIKNKNRNNTAKWTAVAELMVHKR
nr:unnamed protein product [Callosobruchus analis]